MCISFLFCITNYHMMLNHITYNVKEVPIVCLHTLWDTNPGRFCWFLCSGSYRAEMKSLATNSDLEKLLEKSVVRLIHGTDRTLFTEFITVKSLLFCCQYSQPWLLSGYSHVFVSSSTFVLENIPHLNLSLASDLWPLLLASWENLL